LDGELVPPPQLTREACMLERRVERQRVNFGAHRVEPAYHVGRARFNALRALEPRCHAAVARRYALPHASRARLEVPLLPAGVSGPLSRAAGARGSTSPATSSSPDRGELALGHLVQGTPSGALHVHRT